MLPHEICYHGVVQHLIIVVTLLLIVGLLLTVVTCPAGLDKTFSQRVTIRRRAEIYYSLLFMTTLPLLWLFLHGWLAPEYGLDHGFLFYSAVAIVFQIGCTWVPEEGGHKTTIHRLLTGISGVSLIPMVLIIAMSSAVSRVASIVAWIALSSMVVLLAIALVKQQGFRWALLLQICYYALFFIVLLTTTYA